MIVTATCDDHLSSELKQYMDAEAKLKGFVKADVGKYIEKYLGKNTYVFNVSKIEENGK